MLDTLMKIGAHRVDYFEDVKNNKPLLFGFYIRGEITAHDSYIRDAKSQLYAGLMLIHSKMEMVNLRGIYIDVGPLENLQRPAYVQLKQDLTRGMFRRLFILDETALLGNLAAEADLCVTYLEIGGFELLVCKNGECVQKDIFNF